MEDADKLDGVPEWDRLVSDLHHRLKNNLQTITSLISVQAARIADPKVARAVRSIQNRVRAVASVFAGQGTPDLDTIDFGSYLEELIRELAAEYALGERIQIHVITTDTAVEMDDAIPLALIANELAANALEHAFPDETSGEVRATLSFAREACDETEAREYGILEISDDGVPLPSDWASDTGERTGFYLVKALTSQLRAEFSVEERARGKVFRLKFPVES